MLVGFILNISRSPRRYSLFVTLIENIPFKSFGSSAVARDTQAMAPHKALYQALCKMGDTVVYPILPAFLKPAWNHPAGPKTVFFWAPVMKWSLVIAGIADFARPAEKLSPAQNAALCATGAVWARYSFVIIPVNYTLASVNIFLMCVGFTQLCRIAHYRSSHPDAAGTNLQSSSKSH
ncbi:Mitochondrial pyruvate carrier [Trichostrongylus colubriformis]|uniref:Mitochondrial pyruvate carrier n=1 Tax=Trichostrongylus colubriformis TaxID=6319 RepID=A0AAN8ISX3_TRICO